MTAAPRYDGFDGAELAARLRTPGLVCSAEVGSVLDVLHELAADGAPAGTAVLADEQTQGRGRQGRAWHSPKGAGIWLGYLVRPRREPASGVLSLRVGVAVAQALRGLGAPVRVKWPNDIMLDERKLAGILCEARTRGTDRWVAVGLGMNVHGPLPEALRGSAATVDERVPAVTRVTVLERVVPRLHGLSAEAELSDAERRIYGELDWLKDRAVVEPLAGTVRGVAADGALLVETARGMTRVTGGSVRAA